MAETLLKEIFSKAIECDNAGCFMEAQHLYQYGVKIFKNIATKIEDVNKQKQYFERIKSYNDRANIMKLRVKDLLTRGDLVITHNIGADDTGYSYERLFGPFLDGNIKEILIEEPKLSEANEFLNLIAFLELLVKKCENLRFIQIVTKSDPKTSKRQCAKMEHISADMSVRDITVNVHFDNNLDGQKIVLSNGYIIKSGRGLHFFQQADKCTLGLFNYEYRKCLPTDIDIWYSKMVVAMDTPQITV